MQRAKSSPFAATQRATPAEFLAHRNTKFEIEMIQFRLQSIATALDNLNLTDATSKLEWWYELLHEAAGRIHTLQLYIEDPPTYYALDSRAFKR